MVAEEVVRVTVPASLTNKESAMVTGGSLVGLMLIVTVTILLNAEPSFTL